MKLPPRITGTIKRHADGFGFFIPDNSKLPDVYIPRHSMTGVMTNDYVEIEAFPGRRDPQNQLRGEVKKILKRGTRHVVGHFYEQNGNGYLVDESNAWGGSILISKEHAQGAKMRDLVAVEITDYGGDHGAQSTHSTQSTQSTQLRGRVKEILGDIEDPLNDIKRVIYSHHIPHEFSRATRQEAEGFSTEVDPTDYKNRKDLKELPFVTIDGASAKDFDDAVFVSTGPKGFRLWVAIADVSQYVKPNTAIDRDAFQKGTSTYFPHFVVPMLPEVLSNELCSLKPKVPRLVVVAEIHFDFEGETQSSQFYEAVICSQARVTYGEAQEAIDGFCPSSIEHVKENIICAKDLAQILMSKRFREGSLDLEIGDTEIVVDETGSPVDIIRSERLFAHRLIEELMLAANVAVAEFFNKKKAAALYRIHEPPLQENLEQLEHQLARFGLTQSLRKGHLQKQLSKMLQRWANTPFSQALNVLTLRTMNQAQYSSENSGHFGLCFSNYTHFTSPIRRYPDLIVHRLLKHFIVDPKKYPLLPHDELASMGVLLSACEQRSVKAERQLQSIKKARFMKSFVGEKFEGVISSVARFGVFVMLRTYDVDGLIKKEDLVGNKLYFDETNVELVERKSGIRYAIGDTLQVLVARSDIDEGHIDFVLAEPPEERVYAADIKGKTDRADNKKRRPSTKNRRSVRKARVSKRR